MFGSWMDTWLDTWLVGGPRVRCERSGPQANRHVDFDVCLALTTAPLPKQDLMRDDGGTWTCRALGRGLSLGRAARAGDRSLAVLT